MAVTVKIANLDYSESVDISVESLERKVSVLHNKSRLAELGNVPLRIASLNSNFGDGMRPLKSGNRKLLIWDDEYATVDNPNGIVFHGRINRVERVGDTDEALAKIVAADPIATDLGYEADDRAGRYVRDDTGNFINPTFASPITGPQLLYEILVNSQQVGAESDPTPGEGPLPIKVDIANFDDSVGTDMSPENNMSWPVKVGDFLQALVDTNQLDYFARPIDPAEGGDPYHMVELFATDGTWGTDRHTTVTFDYPGDGSSSSAARHIDDWDEYCDKLYDYLGPRKTQTRWAGNVTPGSPGTTTDPTASRSIYGGPGPDYGSRMQIRILDANDTENTVRPLFLRLWDAEQLLRMTPKEMLYLTPSPGSAFKPFGSSYDVGDLVGVSADLGIPDLAGTQRIYGYDVTWTREDVRVVSELLVSADAA